EVFREQRAAMKELTAILATVNDEKTMADAKVLLKERGEKFEATSRKANALPKPLPPEVLKRLEDDRFIMERTMAGLLSEIARVRNLPGGEEFLNDFKSRSPGLMSAVKR